MPSSNVQQAFEAALKQHQAGQLQVAENLCRQILTQQPRHHDAMHLLGVIAFQAGRNDIAVDLMRNALDIHPDWPEAHVNLGNALLRLGHIDEAITAYRHAIAIRPGYADAYGNLGAAFQEKGQLDDAIEAYRRAIALNPDHANTYSNLAAALKAKGLLDEAAVVFRQAIVLNPGIPQLHGALGVILAQQGKASAAVDAFRRALALDPDSAESHFHLANALRDTGALDDSIASYQQSIALNPNAWMVYANLGLVLLNCGRQDEALAACRQAVRLDPASARAHSNLLSLLNLHPAFDAQSIADEQRNWNLRHAHPLRRFIQPHTNDPATDRRLRIGYVSPDFRDHVVAWNMLPLLAHRDRERFEITCYANVRFPDSVTVQIEQLSDRWRNIFHLSDQAVADQIRSDDIDILVDLAVHSADNRLLVFAHKPAPVQLTYLGYCGSTGRDAMDYRLSDPYFDPDGTDLSLYSEKTWRLPKTFWCYQPETAPAPSHTPARINGFVTFGCMNNMAKMSRPALDLWAQILSKVPNSRMIIHAPAGGSRQQVSQCMELSGISADRLLFLGRNSKEDYMQNHSQIDIALDPFPYNGGITTCDALWMGVPVVTLSGGTSVGRGGRSILSNIGLPELIADTRDHYMQIAIDLANDLDRLEHLRQGVRSRMLASPLMDASGFTRDLEAAYRQMWRDWCERR